MTRRLLVTLASLMLVLGATAGTAVAAKPTVTAHGQAGTITKIGTSRLSAAASSAAGLTANGEDEFRDNPEVDAADTSKYVTGSVSAARIAAAHVPRPGAQAVNDVTGSTTTADGLNHYDNRTADGGNKFSLEPPDQALCVSDDWVVESVNTVLRVRHASDLTAATGVMAINPFLGLAAEINRTTGVYGPFISDPKCYYDTATDRWFFTVVELDQDPNTGAFTGGTAVYLAVSQSGDPTATWNVYKIDTTNDGGNGNCPCFGDQPLIGADANGFYISTNVYPLFEAGFNGAEVYAISKAQLAAGNPTPTIVKFFQPTLAEGEAYTLQPATTPPGADFDTERGGTEYFLSALEFTGTVDNRIALWALTNTSSLDTTPDLALHMTVMSSEVYGVPPAMQQKDGPTPLKALLGNKSLAAQVFGIRKSEEHLNMLNSNDDRMQQTVFVDGQIWGALNTVIKGPTGVTRTGIAWFAVAPSWPGGELHGSVSHQGYINVDNNNVAFPAVAANADGDVLVSYTIVGPDQYPSAGYSWISSGTSGAANVARWGDGPADGYVGYMAIYPPAGGVERWGDYGAAVADSSGNLWFAAETINQSCTLSEALSDGFTCGGTRTIYANWGSTIVKVAP